MANHKLPVEDLKKEINDARFDFESTEELEPIKSTIGQERAISAVDFGLNIDSDGYNLFVTGKVGTGRTTTIKRFLSSKAKEERTPPDWCYLNRLSNPDKPRYVKLPPGKGTELADDIDDLIEKCEEKIPQSFESQEFETQNNDIAQEAQEKRNQSLDELRSYAQDLGFKIKITPTGITALPVVDGEPLSKDEFDELPEEKKEEIRDKRQDIQTKINETISDFRNIEKEKKKKVKKLHKEMAQYIVGPAFERLFEKYQDYDKIINFLNEMKNDIIENIEEIWNYQKASEQEQAKLWQGKKFAGPFEKYKVNVLVDNSDTDGAPVVFENNPTYYNLFGSIEYESHYGALFTNFKHIKPGALHKANGGYLVINAEDALTSPFVWRTLKRILKSGKIRTENLGTQYRAIPTVSLKPAPIPLDIKIIMIGRPFIYHLLYEYDSHFKKLFRVKADFDTVMEHNDKHIKSYAQFVRHQVEEDDLNHFSNEAVAKIIEYSMTITSHKEKLSTEFIKIADLVDESSYWSKDNGNQLVQPEDVTTAIEKKEHRSKMPEDKIQELIEEDTLLIDTKEEVVGQINGLSVYDLGDYSFGRPTRITAQTFVGQEGVVNIERKTEMSGPTHSKGVMILSGYLSGKFAQDKPLALSATLCFEQQYGGVRGDSASSTELYTLLSSLADVPLKQGIAVTGSVNQHGKLQPIGGVNQKIEGHYEVCKAKGFTGNQGVLIPRENIKHLMLDDEVINAVENGNFSIYAVDNVKEGIEVLTGMPAGEKKDDGTFEEDTIFGRVDRKLRKMAQKLKSFNKPNSGEEE